MAKYDKPKKAKSYAPLIAIGLTWLIYALCFPLHKPVHYLIAASASGLAWLIVYIIVSVFSGVAWIAQKFREAPFPTDAPHTSRPLPTSGVPETDAVIRDAENTLNTFARLKRYIKDADVKGYIDQMSISLRGICEIVAANPDKMSRLKKFYQYFLPTTIKLLDRFESIEKETSPNQETLEAKERIKAMMKENVDAYERQRERLRSDDIFDIHSDITVMQAMMAREGLVEDPINSNSFSKTGKDFSNGGDRP